MDESKLLNLETPQLEQTWRAQLQAQIKEMSNAVATMADGIAALQRAVMVSTGVTKEDIDGYAEQIEMLHNFIWPLRDILHARAHENMSMLDVLQEFVAIPKLSRPKSGTWYVEFSMMPGEKAEEKMKAVPIQAYLCVDKTQDYVTQELPTDTTLHKRAHIVVNAGLFQMVLKGEAGITQMFACGLAGIEDPQGFMRFLRMFHWEAWDPRKKHAKKKLKKYLIDPNKNKDPKKPTTREELDASTKDLGYTLDPALTDDLDKTEGEEADGSQS